MIIMIHQSSSIAEPDITAKLQPHLASRATIDLLISRACSKTFMRDIDRNQLQPNNTNNKHRALQGNNAARNKAIQNRKAQTKHLTNTSTNTDKAKR